MSGVTLLRIRPSWFDSAAAFGACVWTNASIPCSNSVGILIEKGQHVSAEAEITSIKTFQDLRLLLSQDDDGLGEYLYSRLRVGDAWWIPDEVTGFAEKERHPWIIVQGYSSTRTTVVACPRTSTLKNRRNGIVMPAGLLPDLDRPGLIMLKHRRSFGAHWFRNFDYIGRLPDDIVQNILEFQAAVGNRISR